MNLEEKFKRWHEKALAGEKGYEFLSICDGKHYYRTKKYWGEITAITIKVWDNSGCYIYYDLENTPSANFPDAIAIIIKDGKKMLIFDSNQQLFAFGMRDMEIASRNVIILYRCKEVGSIIVAHKDFPNIRTLDFSEAASDALYFLLRDFLKEPEHLKEFEMKEGGEKHENEFES